MVSVRGHIAYSGSVLRLQARETLCCVDDDVRADLQEAAATLRAAPNNLKAAIIRAARRGENANKITEAIEFVYSPDYVRRIIRDARANGELPSKE